MNNRCNGVEFSKVKSRYRTGPSIIFWGLDVFFIPYNLLLFFKVKRKHLVEAEVLKCKKNDIYKWICPYCRKEEIIFRVPKFKKCSHCNKESYFDPYKAASINLFQNGEKP